MIKNITITNRRHTVLSNHVYYMQTTQMSCSSCFLRSLEGDTLKVSKYQHLETSLSWFYPTCISTCRLVLTSFQVHLQIGDIEIYEDRRQDSLQPYNFFMSAYNTNFIFFFEMKHLVPIALNLRDSTVYIYEPRHEQMLRSACAYAQSDQSLS